jgi:queuine tRNA-ribosyltransferase
MHEFTFNLISTDGKGRAGIFHTPHGAIQTPVFAPVGTQATVKALTPAHLEDIEATLLLANTYHLYLRPGDKLVEAMGGLHQFMGWSGPILTDSGGFQVFSLADRRTVDAEGVTFKSHIDGSEHRFTPESTIQIQERLGADIIMVLDECSAPYEREYSEGALERTHQWAERSLVAQERDDQALFGIIQGGIFPDLRTRSAKFIASLDFPGIAIGGLSVGETKAEMYTMLDVLEPDLPSDKPRYLMGVGSPDDLVEAVVRGIDMFDCVLPTRMARNNAAITRKGRMNLRKATYISDERPIDSSCSCYTCTTFSRAYLRHLIVAQEMLAATLLSIHNLQVLISLAADLREVIVAGQLDEFVEDFRTHYRKHRLSET